MLQICLWSFSHTVSKEKVCSHMNSSVVWSMWHWPEESTYLAQCLLPSPSLEGFPVANAPAIISMHFMLNHQMGRSVFVRRLSKSVSAGRGMLSHKKRRMFVATDTENLWCVNSRKWRLKNISASSWKSRGCEWILKYLLMVYQWTGSLGEPGRKTAEKTRKKKSKWDNAENREKVLWVQVLQLLGEKEEWKGLSVTIVCSRGALRSPSNMAACLFQLLLGEPGRD